MNIHHTLYNTGDGAELSPSAHPDSDGRLFCSLPDPRLVLPGLTTWAYPHLLAVERGQWKAARSSNPPLSPLPTCRMDVDVQGDPGDPVRKQTEPPTAWVRKRPCGTEHCLPPIWTLPEQERNAP